jgi:Zn-dependent protease/CBS domain-containing protein
MRGSFKLGRIAGIEIGIHYTWIFAFILFTWIFASSTFPTLYPGWASATYWITGAAISILLFASVLIHELCHSFVAKSRGMKVSSIVLFIFGGVSNIEAEPEKAWVEFIMAGAGPGSSLVLGGIFYVLAIALTGDSQFVLRAIGAVPTSPGFQVTPLTAVVSYMAYINVLLAIFNIIPAFPLDGGRVFRSIIWGATGSLRTATLVAGNVGRFFGWAMILFGVANIFQFNIFGFQGTFFNGIWFIFIGWFLTSAADSSLREMSLQEHLSGVHVKDVMDRTPECVSPAASVESVVHDAFIQRGRKALPVCAEAGLMGIVTLADVKQIPQDQWANTPVQTVMTKAPLLSVDENDELNNALKVLTQNGLNQIPVMSGGHLAGLLSRADVLRYIQTRQELGIKSSKKPDSKQT